MDPILEIARRHGLVVIEDAAQAHGAEYQGRRCGSMGDIAAFSFYPGKNLGAYGEGGAVVTSDPALRRRRCGCCATGAQEKKYEHRLKGFNYRMDGIQGAILRREAAAPRALDRGAPVARGAVRAAARATRPCGRRPSGPACRHVYHVYAVRVRRPRAVRRARLRERGVADRHPLSDPGAPAAGVCRSRLRRWRLSRERSRRPAQVLSLPMFPELTDAQVEGRGGGACATSAACAAPSRRSTVRGPRT